MRVPAALLVLILSLPVMAARPTPGSQVPGAAPTADCPRTTSYLAGRTGIYRGPRLKPKNLTELPPGTAFMAVYRHIGACEVPLTMVDYRNPRRR